MIELKKDIDRKKIPENENLNKIVHIVKRILGFHKEQNGKGLPRILPLRPSDLAHKTKVSDCKVFNRKHIKILSPKQMLQRLSILLAQVKACNTPEKLLNEIKQIIYSLYRAKGITNVEKYKNVVQKW